ncbi:MAG TPA: MFS transporter [Candidatus Limnocylindrales bacterium]
MSTSAGRPSRSVLRNIDFRKLWAAQAISVYGTQVTVLAVPLVAALTLRVSPFEFGLLGTLEFLPFALLSLPAGVWVDRLRRRPILILADLVRAVLLLSIPAAVIVDRLTLPQLYVVVFANGCLTVFFDVAAQSFLPTMLERDQLVDGNSKLELTRTTSQRLGPGLAGVLIGVMTAPFAIVIDSISYLLSAAFLSWIRRPERPVDRQHGGTDPGRSMRAEIGAGVRYVFGHPWLRAMAVAVAIGNLFGNVADSILILFLVTERGFTAAQIGFAFTIGSIGVIGGALAVNRLTRRLGVGRTLLFSEIGSSLSWLPIAVAPDALLFPALALTITALGFFAAGWNVNAVSLRQAITPLPMQGRTNATMRFISWGLIPVGTLVGGLLGSTIGLHNAIWVGALGAMFGFVPVALSSVRHLRSMPSAIDGDSARPTSAEAGSEAGPEADAGSAGA